MKTLQLLFAVGLLFLIALAAIAFHSFEADRAFKSAQQNSNKSLEAESSGNSDQDAGRADSSDGSSSQGDADRKNSTEALLRLAETIQPKGGHSDAAGDAFDDGSKSDVSRSDFERMDPKTRIYFEGTSYLTDEEFDRYLQLDDSQLLALAEAGDVGAQIRLGVRLIKTHHNVTDGMDWLIEAASHGSFEALRELRWLYQWGGGPIKKDDFAFLAWAKVAYMVGDWQALWFQGALSRLTAKEMMVTDVLAAYYFDEINTRHVLRTSENLEVMIRPGFKQALQQYLNHSSENKNEG